MAITELYDSRTLTIGFREWKGQICYDCDNWDDRVTEAPALGSAHPEFPQMYAETIDFEPMGQPLGSGKYQHCKITVNYTTREQTSGQENIEFGGQGLDIADQLVWADTGDPVGQPITIPQPFAIYTREVIRTVIPWTVIMGLLGKINDAAYHGHPTRTLMFEGASAVRERNATGNLIYRLCYRFVRTMNQHIYVLRKDDLVWAIPQTTGGTYIYQDGDFSTLPE